MEANDRAVVVVGGANLDVLARSSTELHPGRSMPGRVRLSAGGAGRNVAVNLARLGERVRLIAGVSDDLDGRWVTAQTADAGVDVRGVTSLLGQANYYVALLEDDRVQWAVSDMSAAEALLPEAMDAQAEWFQAAAFVVIDANLAPATIRRVVETANAPICLLPTSPAKANRLSPVLAAARLIVLSAEEARELTGQPIGTTEDAVRIARQLQSSGESVVVITMGMRGVGWIAKETVWLPGIPVPVVDPTGAGDAVAAAAIYSVLHGFDPQTGAALARAAGAMTAIVEGATHPGLSVEALRAYG